jgi:uncharacterized membrane protein (UPF0127 family)
MVRAWNVSRDVQLGDQILVANTHWARLRGMLGRPEPEPGEGLLLDPCQAVHMYWMRFALDVAFLDNQGEVVAVYHELEPARLSGRHKEAIRALELRAGTLEKSGTQVGDRIALEPIDI